MFVYECSACVCTCAYVCEYICVYWGREKRVGEREIRKNIGIGEA